MKTNAFTDIKNYGVIGDSRTAALVSSHGSIDWCCLPKFDSPSFFSAILDTERGGRFSIQPTEPFSSTQTYVSNTNILETTFTTPSAAVSLKDCFIAATEHEKRQELYPDHEIIRIIECLSGGAHMRLHFSPRSEYGRHKMNLNKIGNGRISCCRGRKLLTLQISTGAQEFKVSKSDDHEEIIHNFKIRAGDKIIISLSYAEEAPAVIPSLQKAEARFQKTKNYWENWIGASKYDGLYKDHVRRSALALRLLAFAPSGAILASPTTSLPEAIGFSRNWDYRFCWLRDASFTIRALIDLGFLDEAKAYMSWLLHSTRLTWPRLQVAYTVYGEAKIPERTLGWLRGYKNSMPVHIGNGAYDQHQLDFYGEVIDGFFRLLPHLDGIDNETQKLLLGMADTVCREWNHPDNGIWELRSGSFHHTHSKVMAWVALDRVIKMSQYFSRKAPLEKYQTTLLQIRSAIETYGYDEKLGSYVRSFGEKELDSSLLVMTAVGYCDAKSPRMRNTVNRILNELGRNGLIYRYKPETDGLKGKEGAFVICGFWLVEALALEGRHTEARQYFETFLTHTNETGLWPEEIDPDTGEFLGNFPQGFSHIGLINAAIALTNALKQEKAA